MPLFDYFIVAGVQGMTEEIGAPQLHQCKTATEAQTCRKRIAYRPEVLECYPEVSAADESLVSNVPMFSLPMGALVENWAEGCRNNGTAFSTSVLTDKHGTRHFLTSLSFYETFSGQMDESQLERLGLCVFVKAGRRTKDVGANAISERITHREGRLHALKSISVVSSCPFFDAFRSFLSFLYSAAARLTSTQEGTAATSGCFELRTVEAYVSRMMAPQISVPVDLPARFKLGGEFVSFHLPHKGVVPHVGAAFAESLKSLGPENLLYAMMLVLLEQKVLLHSQRPWLLTAVAETLRAAIFPFNWQCPYIPHCPLALTGVMHAPVPFIVGVQASCLDTLDVPRDVICFDLDSGATVKRTMKLSSFPKRPLKHLRATLDDVHKQLQAGAKHLRKRMGRTISEDAAEQVQLQKQQWEGQIREAFLRFMAETMYGYAKHLPAMVDSLQDVPDSSSLFEVDAFINEFHKHARSATVDFYRRLSQMQCFSRFVEECVIKSERSAYADFFDSCISRVYDERLRGVKFHLLPEQSQPQSHPSRPRSTASNKSDGVLQIGDELEER